MTDKRQPDGHSDGQPDRQNDRYDEQLDALFKQLGVEKAPPGLTRRLYRIPAEEGYAAGWRKLLRPAAVPRWVLVPAFAAALLAVGVVLMLPEPTLPQRPTQAEVLQARQDLALAFKYIDKAGVITGRAWAGQRTRSRAVASTALPADRLPARLAGGAAADRNRLRYAPGPLPGAVRCNIRRPGRSMRTRGGRQGNRDPARHTAG